MSNATVKDPPAREPAPVIPVDAREDLKAKFSEWQALIRKRVELTSKLDEAKNRETALLQTSESSDSEETVRQLQDAQTKQRVYAAQIAQADRDSDAAYDEVLQSFKAAVDELARKVESLRASRKAAHWEIFTDRIDTGALLSVRLSASQLYYAFDCAKDILALNACRPHQWHFLRGRYTSLNPNRPEPPADPDTVKRGMDDVLACYAKFETEAAKNYNFKPYPPEPIQDEPKLLRASSSVGR
jgi:hypothetical protein